MVLTENFRCFVNSILLSNTVGNGIVCADASSGRRGWSGTGGINDSVVAFTQLTDTQNNKISYAFYGSSAGAYGYFGQQASLNKFDPENGYATSDNSLRGVTFFRVGSGTTAAAANDCNLESEIPVENVKINLSSVHLMENGSAVLRFYVTVKNIDTEAIAVSEIGMFKFLSGINYETAARVETPFLFGRNVLPSTVTIEPQDLRIFVVDIKI